MLKPVPNQAIPSERQVERTQDATPIPNLTGSRESSSMTKTRSEAKSSDPLAILKTLQHLESAAKPIASLGGFGPYGQKTRNTAQQRTRGTIPKARNIFSGLVSSSCFSGNTHSVAPSPETRPAAQSMQEEALFEEENLPVLHCVQRVGPIRPPMDVASGLLHTVS